MNDEWNKSPYIANRKRNNNGSLTAGYEYKEWEIKNEASTRDKAREQYLQRVRNLTRPLSHYKKL
jgi:hypothetical protein